MAFRQRKRGPDIPADRRITVRVRDRRYTVRITTYDDGGLDAGIGHEESFDAAWHDEGTASRVGRVRYSRLQLLANAAIAASRVGS